MRRKKIGHSKLLLAGAAVLSPLRPAAAQTSQWIGGTSNWNTPGNWSPSGVPGANDTVSVTSTLGLSQTITYDYTGSAVALSRLAVDLTGGSDSASEILSMDADSLSIAGSEYVGYDGTGIFNQTGGSNTSTINGQYLGYNAGSTGTYILSGTGLLKASTEYIGFGGAGAFNQFGGVNTILGSTGSLEVGYIAGSTGTYTLSGTGTLVGGGDEDVGYNGSGVFIQSGGINTIRVESSALVVGNRAFETGTYILSGTGSLSVNAYEYVGLSGNGIFNQSGGINTIGPSDVASRLAVGGNAGTTGTYILSGTGALSVSGHEVVGLGGNGTFNQSGGANVVADELDLAEGGDSKGTYILSGGSVTAQGSVFVGGSGPLESNAPGGTGVLTVSNTGQLAVAGTMTVFSGGRANLDVPNTTVGNISIVANGIVNLNGGLTINYGSPASDPIATIVGYLQSGYNNGAWTGTSGIISTSITGGSPALSIGYSDGNTDPGTAAGPNQIVIKYTLLGDTNLDGLVNFGDLVAVLQNFNKGGTDWAHGNFGYAASTSFGDLVAVLQNYNKTLPPPSGSAVELGGGSTPLTTGSTIPIVQSTDVQLPEPAAIALAGIAAAGVLARRRRKRV